MIIDNSNIVLASTHSQVKEYKKSEELRAWVGNVKPQEQTHAESDDKVSISEKALRHLKKDIDKAIKHLEKDLDKVMRHPEKGLEKAMRHLDKGLDKAIRHLEKDIDSEKIKKIKIDNNEATRLGLIKRLVEAFTGKKIMLNELKEWLEDNEDHNENDDDKEIHSEEDRPDKQAWGISYNRHESFYEHEQMSFNAAGVIRTADGREINFSLDLMMSREFMYENALNVAAGGVSAGDIVIDFDGPYSELSNAKFDFQLEPEEDNEIISYLALGSGLLSLDLNGDGEIDDLNELFGPSTGNAFTELAAYDEDGNNWIDENDSIYNSLKIWNQDSEGNAVLNNLKDENVGAIYLANINSEFALKDNDNRSLGQIDKSGIYLNENGTVGTVQQISIIV